MDEALEIAMDIVERRTHSLKRVDRSWNILMSFFSNHLNGKTRSRKMGPGRMLTK